MDGSESLPPGILATNHVPSPEQCNLIRESLIPLYVQRSVILDAEVGRIQATFTSLLQEQRANRELLEAHRALLSPMRRLIPDVLLEIFHHCHDHYLEAPMRLMRICHKWRELVRSTPTLWTMIMLHDTIQTHRVVPFAQACIQYSGSCPIQVVIKFLHRRTNGNLVRRELSKALEILTLHAHRWQKFEMFLDSTYRLDVAGFRLPINTPLLESLVLVTDPHTSLRLSHFAHLPRLRVLRLPNILPQDVPLLLQSTTLRNLSVGGTSHGELTLTDCRKILFNCSDIESFDIVSVKSDSAVLFQEEITLPRLQELRIGPFAADPAPLIHSIKAPALQRLRLLVGQSIHFDSQCVTRLVHRCRPPLRSLSLVNMDGAEVVSCLPLLPHLTTLTLQHTDALDLVITCLTEKDSQGRFRCPALVHLGLRLCLFTGERLVRLARERRAVAGGLRVVVDKQSRSKPGEFVGLTIELSQVGEFSDAELKELYDLQITYIRET